MGYPAIAKSLANTALDSIPGGSVAKGVVKGVGSLLGIGGKGPKYAKSLAETRAAGKAGDIATLQFKLANTKYPEVAKSAKAYLDLLLAKSTGSRSDGWLQTKAQHPVLVAGGGPMSGATGRTQLKAMGHVAFTPDGQYVAYNSGEFSTRTGKRRKRRKTTRTARRKSSSARRNTKRSRRKSSTRKKGRKLKFGSAAYRKKYLGHK